MNSDSCTRILTISIALLCCAFPAAPAASVAVWSSAKAAVDLGIGSRTILGITLGRSNLADVQKKLGPTKQLSVGDAALAEERICYITQEPEAVVLVFASNSEMSGPPENIVTDIRIIKNTAYEERSNCRPLPFSGGKISTENIRKILGTPTRIHGSKWNYFWSVEVLLPTSHKYYQYWAEQKEECFEGKAPFFRIVSGIKVQFDQDRVVALSLSRMENIC